MPYGGHHAAAEVASAAGAARPFSTITPPSKVVVAAGDRLRTVRIIDLLPESYVWADHQLETE